MSNRFEREVRAAAEAAGEVLSEAEIQRRAGHAMKAHMALMAFKSSRVRRARKAGPEADLCVVCRWAPRYAKDRCAACYSFQRRHRRDKTEAEVVVSAQRAERRMALRR